MKSAHSCRLCGRWLEGEWSTAEPAARVELQRQMDQGHCDVCPRTPGIKPQWAREYQRHQSIAEGAQRQHERELSAAEAELRDNRCAGTPEAGGWRCTADAATAHECPQWHREDLPGGMAT